MPILNIFLYLAKGWFNHPLSIIESWPRIGARVAPQRCPILHSVLYYHMHLFFLVYRNYNCRQQGKVIVVNSLTHEKSYFGVQWLDFLMIQRERRNGNYNCRQ